MPSAVQKIVDEMTELVPPGQLSVDYESRDELQRLTALLLDTDRDGVDEYLRYRAITERSLDMSPVDDRLRAAYSGRRVLVTGGTGCIGSRLVRQLLSYDPAAVFVIHLNDRPALDGFDPVPGVVYLELDISDEARTRQAIRDVRPDVIFHCAAQRSPWLAERRINRTLSSNVVGTRNVLRGARDVDPERFVHASTGKAMRYYTSDVYAASKKLAEWLVADYSNEGRHAGLARFTHVVDNAVLLERVDEALDRPSDVVRVHDPETWFYAQSADESAQLLLLTGIAEDAGTDETTHGAAIRSLGDPANLLDVVVGRIATSPRPQDAAIYFSGSERGYELRTPPGLYDPTLATDVSPLVNAIEARTARPVAGADNVDRFTPAVARCDGDVESVVAGVEQAAREGTPIDAATELAHAGSQLAEATFAACPDDVFYRVHSLAASSHGTLPTSRRPAHDAKAAV